MELLAPVGSKEAFITALRAGADAVYIGVPDFNARLASSGINLFDLKVFIGHAHEKGVKVYLALNTLVKHEEIGAAVKWIAVLDKLSPDAFIVQDLGVAHIINKYFPDIPLHASTQMAAHNSQGVEFLAQNGFKRVIMARELSFAELKLITNGALAGIEVFVHGALCFCVSGMCLFSSFIGGLSGNRGRCTQPCRRLWRGGAKRGYLFSPKDLELAAYIGKLKEIGVASLKIEGRMRSSEYVYRTVKAYRMLLDASESDYPAVLEEAQKILGLDAAREKTAGLFSGRDETIFQPGKAQCLGNLIGTLKRVSGESLDIELAPGENVADGDRLRVSNPATDTTASFRVKEFKLDGNKCAIPFGRAGEFTSGNPVYKTVDGAFDQKGLEKDIDQMYEDFKKASRGSRSEEPPPQHYTALISNKWKEAKKTVRLDDKEGGTLWARFDNISWQGLLPPPGQGLRHIFYLTKDNLHAAERIESSAVSGTAIEITPFIAQRDTPAFKHCVDKLSASGVNKWVLNNVSHFGFFKGMECELSAGQFLYTWNAYAAAFLSDLGVKYFTVSWEDDFLNIRKMCGPGLGGQLVVYLHGLVPLVRSRLLTKETLGAETVSDASPPAGKGGKAISFFNPVFESGLAALIPDKPFNIFSARSKLRECGILNFGIDLNFTKPDKKFWDTLVAGYRSEDNVKDSYKFNFKRLVK